MSACVRVWAPISTPAAAIAGFARACSAATVHRSRNVVRKRNLCSTQRLLTKYVQGIFGDQQRNGLVAIGVVTVVEGDVNRRSWISLLDQPPLGFFHRHQVEPPWSQSDLRGEFAIRHRPRAAGVVGDAMIKQHHHRRHAGGLGPRGSPPPIRAAIRDNRLRAVVVSKGHEGGDALSDKVAGRLRLYRTSRLRQRSVPTALTLSFGLRGPFFHSAWPIGGIAAGPTRPHVGARASGAAGDDSRFNRRAGLRPRNICRLRLRAESRTGGSLRRSPAATNRSSPANRDCRRLRRVRRPSNSNKRF